MYVALSEETLTALNILNADNLEANTVDSSRDCRAPDKVHIFTSIMPISSPNPTFVHLLESSHRDDSNKWSNIGFSAEINKNWVTVHDKCPQINEKFKWYTFLKKKHFFLTDGQTNGQTDGQTVRFYYAPNFIWGHKKLSPKSLRQTYMNLK